MKEKRDYQISDFRAPGSTFEENMIAVDDRVQIRVSTFQPAKPSNNPPVLFIAGWISLPTSWKAVLAEITKDFTVYYVETREKISSIVKGKVDYGIAAIGADILKLVEHLKLEEKRYIMFGSSLGATAILDCCRFANPSPRCLVLVGPNAEFRVPKWGYYFVKAMPPALYLMFKPFVKWYLKNFRLNVESDYEQYVKYCQALDAANPWKLKKAMLQLSKYQVWDILDEIDIPTLIAGASEDKLHEPENLKNIVAAMKHATYIDLGTNARTHEAIMIEEMRAYLKSLD
jgi:pimeloyl-ACP methyl ester carboxylesterase